jgi:hypothetical protein
VIAIKNVSEVVRELKGPHNDPQHPYMYEEEDLWMAPGFINMFYEVGYTSSES